MDSATGILLARKRRTMGLSQRKAASMVERIYGVKLSHSYLSMIERGLAQSISESLEEALMDFLKLDRNSEASENGSGAVNGSSRSGYHRIPLYDGSETVTSMDITTSVPADYAVKSTYNIPGLCIFVGDILLCRHTPPTEGDLVAVKKDGNRFSFRFFSARDNEEVAGTVLMVIKQSVNLYFHKWFMENTTSSLDEEFLIRAMAAKTGIKESDLRRSLAVLMSFGNRKKPGSDNK